MSLGTWCSSAVCVSSTVPGGPITPVFRGFAFTVLWCSKLCAFCLDPCGLGIYACLRIWNPYSCVLCVFPPKQCSRPECCVACPYAYGHVCASGCNINMFRTVTLGFYLLLFMLVLRAVFLLLYYVVASQSEGVVRTHTVAFRMLVDLVCVRGVDRRPS